MRKTLFSLLFFSFFFLTLINPAGAAVYKFPRLANYYLNPKISREDYGRLASYDLVILDMEYQNDYPDLFPYLRKHNPRIIILAYLATQDVHPNLNFDFSPYKLRQEFLAGIKPDWWLKNSKGESISTWPGTEMLNIATAYRDYLVDFINQKIMTSGIWDGVFLDVVLDGVSWINNGDIDLDGDGVKEESNILNSEWQKAMKDLLFKLRNSVGQEKIILANGGTLYSENINGRMFETFPSGDGKPWEDVISNYQAMKEEIEKPVFVINSNTENTDNKDDYQRMRFGLASAMLFDAYYSFDYGTNDHGQFWWYDEYNIDLGKPLGEAYRLARPAGVWRRDFLNGIVLVNPIDKEKLVDLEHYFKIMAGRQDALHNNGGLVNKILLQPNDAIILLKEKDIYVYPNKSYLPIKVFDIKGNQLKNYFGLRPKIEEENLIYNDLNGDGIREIIQYFDNSAIKISSLEGRLLVPVFYGYSPNYYGGINLIIDDLNGDGKKEIIVSSKKWSGHIRIFDYNGRLINQFFAYDKNLLGGYRVGILGN